MLFPSLFPFLLTSGESATTTYDEIRACGESMLDEWSFYNTDVTNTQIQDYGDSEAPEWGINTISLGHYDSNLDWGNFPESDRPVTHWRILRKKYGTTDPFAEIGFIPNTNVNIFYDTKAASNTSYVYAIQGVSNGTRGSAIFAVALGPDGEPIEAVKVLFYGWQLSSIDYNPETEVGISYSFIAENETDAISHNLARTVYESAYSKYGKVERGTMNYRSGRLTTMPFDCVDSIATFGNNEKREELLTFLNNGDPKILKNGSGLTLVIDTFEASFQYMDKISNVDMTQPYSLSFGFIEIEDISNV